MRRPGGDLRNLSGSRARDADWRNDSDEETCRTSLTVLSLKKTKSQGRKKTPNGSKAHNCVHNRKSAWAVTMRRLSYRAPRWVTAARLPTLTCPPLTLSSNVQDSG